MTFRVNQRSKQAAMSIYAFFSRVCPFLIPRRAIVMLGALAWSSLALGGEIHDAAMNGDLDKVKALLTDNPDLVNSITPDNGWTPLLYAAGHGHKDVAELLLANKADANAKDPFGFTPLTLVADHGHKDMAELLLAYKADVNARTKGGSTPLLLGGVQWQPRSGGAVAAQQR